MSTVANYQASTPEGRRAVLWDLDGTMIDSSEFHWQAWREALDAEGFRLTRKQFAATFGQRNEEILRGYFGRGFPAHEIARISEMKETLYRRLVRTNGVELLPGVAVWLARLRAGGWRQAIASSAPLLNIEAILDSLAIRDYFDAVISAEDVERGKPDPQVFLAAAAKLDVRPQRSIVVEDAPAGCEAARRAAMRCVGVLSSHAELHADVVVRTLTELDERAFDDLLSGAP